jgi:rubredoxin
MNLRKQRADWRAARELLELHHRLQNSPERDPGRPRSERRAEARARLLPEPRVCPTCGMAKPRSKQWVVRENIVQCLSCDRAAQASQGSKS